jgi:hypothetical protein
MSTTPTIPTPASSEPAFDPATATTEQIAAAIVAAKTQGQQPPVTNPPVTPAEPGQPVAAAAPALPTTKGDWGEAAKNADGSFTVKLVTGEVFTAKDDLDLATKMGSAHVATKKWAQEKTAPQPTTTPAMEADAARQQLVDKYFATVGTDPVRANLEATAFGLGFGSVEEMVESVKQMRSNAQVSQSDALTRDFLRSNPDFPNTDEATGKLLGTIQDAGLPINLNTLKMAHAQCVKDNLYKPLSKEEQQAALMAGLGLSAPAVAKPNNPPMVTGSATVVTTEKDPSQMTLDELTAKIKSERAKLGL